MAPAPPGRAELRLTQHRTGECSSDRLGSVNRSSVHQADRGTENANRLYSNVQTAGICWRTHTDARLPTSFPFTATHRYSCRLTRLQTANGNGRKEASGRPVEISHLIALHLQVASAGFRQERGLLSKPGVVRMYKAGGAHTALTPSTLCCWGPGLTATCYLILQGLKLMLAAWRLIYDKHLFLSSWALSQTVSGFPREHCWCGAGLRGGGRGVEKVWACVSSSPHPSRLPPWPNKMPIYMTLQCWAKVNTAEISMGWFIWGSKWGVKTCENVSTHTSTHSLTHIQCGCTSACSTGCV